MVTPKELQEELRQGRILHKNQVSSPLVPGSEIYERGAVDKAPNHKDEKRGDRESQEGRLPSIKDQQAVAPGKDTHAIDEEALQKEELIRQAAMKTEELARSLQKTEEERGKPTGTPEEERKHEEQVVRETKKHEEKKQDDKFSNRETPVLHGSATLKSMKEEERQMNLKPDATPLKRGGDEPGRGM